MTYIVALTGGIGSGKSTIANYFVDLGVPVIDTDVLAKELVAPKETAYKKIIERFGPTILDAKGEINRQLLREKIFNHLEDRMWLEALLHPAIYLLAKENIGAIDYPYCIVVIPLLAEHYEQYQDLIDHVLVIDTDEDKQLAWTAKRDHCSESLIKKMMLAQVTSNERNKIADTLLTNNASLDLLKNKIKDLHQEFLKKAGSRADTRSAPTQD